MSSASPPPAKAKEVKRSNSPLQHAAQDRAAYSKSTTAAATFMAESLKPPAASTTVASSAWTADIFSQMYNSHHPSLHQHASPAPAHGASAAAMQAGSNNGSRDMAGHVMQHHSHESYHHDSYQLDAVAAAHLQSGHPHANNHYSGHHAPNPQTPQQDSFHHPPHMSHSVSHPAAAHGSNVNNYYMYLQSAHAGVSALNSLVQTATHHHHQIPSPTASNPASSAAASSPPPSTAQQPQSGPEGSVASTAQAYQSSSPPITSSL